MKNVKILLLLTLLSSIAAASDYTDQAVEDHIYDDSFGNYTLPEDQADSNFYSVWNQKSADSRTKNKQAFEQKMLQAMQAPENAVTPAAVANVNLEAAIKDPSALSDFYQNPSLQAAFNAVTDPIVGITALTGVAAYALYYKYQQYLKDQARKNNDMKSLPLKNLIPAMVQ